MKEGKEQRQALLLLSAKRCGDAMDVETIQKLKNPSSEYRAKPFWAWNGKLEKEELGRQIECMKEMGFGGFFMHARTGLETEYLSEEWFSLVRFCAEKAYSLGMEAWLYDEDRWPSGTCGGKVTENPENRLRFLSLYSSESEALACPEVVSIRYRYAVKKQMDPKGEERLLDAFPVAEGSKPPDGYALCVFAEEEQKREDFYNGYTYLNVLDRRAAQAFLESTHEQYEAHCGDLFGKEIKGFFTDEPHRGAMLCGFGLRNENRLRMIPYTEGIEARYTGKTGKEFSPPEIFWRREGETFHAASCGYIDVLDDLLTENFALPCETWCREHGLLLTGHVLHEDNLSVQAAMIGSCMRYYETMDIPGMDVLCEDNSVYWAAKQVSSVSRQLGKRFSLSEMYGATGWGMTLNRYKQVGDWQALFGINFRCPHLSWYTMKGEAKRDYPASILHQSAWAGEWRDLEDYFGRLSVLTAEGERICDTLVVQPMRRMWGSVREGWMCGLEARAEDVKRQDAAFSGLFLALVRKGVDFDYGDEELIRRYGKIVSENGRTYLRVGEIKYRQVFCPDAECMAESTAEILERFRGSGGHVARAIAELDTSGSIVCPEGIACAAYRFAGEIWIFFLNLEKEKAVGGTVDLPRKWRGLFLEEQDFRSGTVAGEISRCAPDSFVLRLCGGQEKIVRLTKEKPEKKQGSESPFLPLPETFFYSLSEPNVLPLDEAVWETDGKIRSGGKEEDILLIDRKIRTENGRKARGGDMLQPWFEKKSGIEEKRICSVRLTFSFYSEETFEDCRLAAEESGYILRVNGEEVGGTCKGERWVDACFCLHAVTVRKGKNIVEFEGGFPDGGGLEAVYLLGNFAVGTDRVLKRLPEKIRAGNLVPQGFPYYGGAICYKTGIRDGSWRLHLQDLGGAVLNLREGDRKKTLAFAPYDAEVRLSGEELILELVLTRRNTFGPLHEKNPRNFTAPESFLQEGEERSEKTCSIPQGLLLEK